MHIDIRRCCDGGGGTHTHTYTHTRTDRFSPHSHLHFDVLTEQHSSQLFPLRLELQCVFLHLVGFLEHIIEFFPSLQYLVDVIRHHVLDFFNLALDSRYFLLACRVVELLHGLFNVR